MSLCSLQLRRIASWAPRKIPEVSGDEQQFPAMTPVPAIRYLCKILLEHQFKYHYFSRFSPTYFIAPMKCRISRGNRLTRSYGTVSRTVLGVGSHTSYTWHENEPDRRVFLIRLSSTTVALLNSAAIDVVGSGIAGLVPDGVVSTATRTEPAQQCDSPSIRGG